MPAATRASASASRGCAAPRIFRYRRARLRARRGSICTRQCDAELRIEPGARALVPTGCRIAVPPGYEAQVRPRSGLALRHGIVLPNAPGTIDADYRGEIQVILLNAGREPFTVRRGDRIAQLVIAPVARAELARGATSSTTTARGAGGFGHTRHGRARRARSERCARGDA